MKSVEVYQTEVFYKSDLCSDDWGVLLASISVWNNQGLRTLLIGRTTINEQEQKTFDGITKELLANPFNFFQGYLLKNIHEISDAETAIREIVDHFTFSSIHSYGWFQHGFPEFNIVQEITKTTKVPQPRNIVLLPMT